MSLEQLRHVNTSNPPANLESSPTIQDATSSELAPAIDPQVIAQELSETYPTTPPEGHTKATVMEDSLINLLKPPTAEEMSSSDEAWRWMFYAISTLGLKSIDDGESKNKLNAAGIEAVYPFGEINKGQGESLRFKDVTGGEYFIHRGWTGESPVSGDPETMSHVTITYSTEIPGPHGEKFEWGVIAHKQSVSLETKAYTLTDITQEGGIKIVRKGEEDSEEGFEEGHQRYVKLAAEAKRALEQLLPTVDPMLATSIDNRIESANRHSEQMRQVRGTRIGRLLGRFSKH